LLKGFLTDGPYRHTETKKLIEREGEINKGEK
jgi:hypothetical protein